MLKTIIYLIPFLFFVSLQVSKNVQTEQLENEAHWKIIENNEDIARFSYEATNSQAQAYFEGSDCYSQGWITCQYVHRCSVVFYKTDKLLKITEMYYPYAFSAPKEIITEWYWQNDKAVFDVGFLFFSFPSFD